MVFTGTPIEIMALILVVFSLLKIVIIFVKPEAWLNSVVKKVWENPSLMMIVSLVLAGVSLYYLLDSGLTIVQILAVTLFVALLMAVGVAIYIKEIVGIAENLLKDKSILKKSWFYIVLWIALMVWGLYELFVV